MIIAVKVRNAHFFIKDLCGILISRYLIVTSLHPDINHNPFSALLWSGLDLCRLNDIWEQVIFMTRWCQSVGGFFGISFAALSIFEEI